MSGSGSLRLIDVHSHLNFNAYKDDADEVIGRSLNQGIGLFVVGSQSTTSAEAVKLADGYDGIWAIIGLHPIHLFEREVDEEEVEFKSRKEDFDPEYYRSLATGSSRVVGIGECGLDYFHKPDGVGDGEFRRVQEAAFRAQIDLALELDLPLMVHCRDAHSDVADMIEEYVGAGKEPRGNIHCFTGTVAEAERYVGLGFHISFTGIVTYPPRAADKAAGRSLDDVIRAVPMEKILVETDAPYLSPVPHRGKRNEPAFVEFVAGKIAEVKGVDEDEVARVTLQNTRRLFGIGD